MYGINQDSSENHLIAELALYSHHLPSHQHLDLAIWYTTRITRHEFSVFVFGKFVYSCLFVSTRIRHEINSCFRVKHGYTRIRYAKNIGVKYHINVNEGTVLKNLMKYTNQIESRSDEIASHIPSFPRITFRPNRFPPPVKTQIRLPPLASASGRRLFAGRRLLHAFRPSPLHAFTASQNHSRTPFNHSRFLAEARSCAAASCDCDCDSIPFLHSRNQSTPPP